MVHVNSSPARPCLECAPDSTLAHISLPCSPRAMLIFSLQVGSSVAILGTYLYTVASDKFAAEQKAKKAAEAKAAAEAQAAAELKAAEEAKAAAQAKAMVEDERKSS